MPMQEALAARLAGAAPIGALVGDRVDWFDRPDGFPALSLTMVSPGREWTMDGPDELDEPWVHVEAWANTKAQVAALKRAVVVEMEQPRSVDGVTFHEASLESERWDRPDDLDDGTAVFRVSMDFRFFCEEA